MEAIKSVENEVDKVVRLFSSCKENCDNEIDNLIKVVKEAKQELESLTSRKYNMQNVH